MVETENPRATEWTEWQACQTQKNEIWKEYGTYTLLDVRKAARHCRETMEAYLRLAEKSDLGLIDLDKEQMKVYSGGAVS